MSDDPKRKTCDDAEEAWETGGEWEEVVRGKAAASLLAPQSAVAAALKAGVTRLRELKLANQRVTYSQVRPASNWYLLLQRKYVCF